MQTSRRFVGYALGAMTVLAACAEPVDDIDRTKPNAIKKSLFTGEWYYGRTVVDAPYETEQTFVGDRQEWALGEDFPAHKIRWRIEEDFLLACRVDEVVIGSNTAGQSAGEEDRKSEEYGADEKFPCRHPVASFAIIEHFDIQREYNSSTGEQSNVISENGNDRRWFDREYIRVDWTDIGLNDLNFSLEAFSNLGISVAESKYYVQEETGDCRSIREDGTTDYSACEEGFLPPVVEDQAILVTNRITVSSGDGLISCFYAGTHCTLNEIGMRYSFRRVPERTTEEQYEPIQYPDTFFERFGIWRANKSTYTVGRGETDFKSYLGTRWNIFDKTHDADGKVLPLSARGVRSIDYYLNREFPSDLKRAAFELSKEWNDAFQGVWPGKDITRACKVLCGEGAGKPIDQCGGSDVNFRMEGECAFRLHENSGNEFLGDLRYNFIAFIEDPSVGQPCGVGGPANDPETGELINAVSYIYGAQCFDSQTDRVLDMIDLLCVQKSQAGEDLPKGCKGIDENQFLRGLRVLEVAQAQGSIQGPAVPIQAIPAAGEVARSDEFRAQMEPLRLRMEDLKHNRSALHTRREKLRREGIDRLLVTDELAHEASHGRVTSGMELTDEELAEVSPLTLRQSRGATAELVKAKMAAKAIEPAEFLFTDDALWALAQKYADLEREDLRQVLREALFRSVTLHELGHNMGLRHNFIASFDRTNYFPEYWDIKKSVAARFEEQFDREAPELEPFWDEGDETREEFLERYKQWDEDRKVLRQMEAAANIKQYMYSSIMDYSGLIYNDWNGLGAYDKAAMRFIYGGLVDRAKCESRTAEGCDDLTDRETVRYYAGGELCGVDGDCPASGAGQKCRTSEAAGGAKVCSNWDDDEKNSDRLNIRHKFCSDDRVDDQPFCNRFDEGESAEDIVRNMVDQYSRSFIFTNFRRYRAGFSVGAYYNQQFDRFRIIGDMMQSLLYKYYYEPGFTNNNGPGGFYDMFRATVAGFDFLGNVVAQPQAGSYEWNENEEVYEFNDTALLENPTSDLINVPLGQGKTLYSSYERGYFGEIERLSYVGVFYDKLAALEILTLRDFGTQSFNNEERFSLSFYDFFPNAFTDVLGAFVANDTTPVAMAYDPDTKTLRQRTYWDGNFFGRDSGFDPADLQLEGRRIEPGATTNLSIYALIYGMINTPYYNDLSFTNSMRAFELGGKTSVDIAGTDEIGGVDPEDVNSYESPVTHRTFVALRTENVNSVAWRAIERARVLSQRYADLRDALERSGADATSCELLDNSSMRRDTLQSEVSSAEYALTSHEDQLTNLVHVIDLVGIGSL